MLFLEVLALNFRLDLNSETVDQAFPAIPTCVDPHTSIREVFHIFKEQRKGCILICRDETLIGIFTERDALRLMAEAANLDRPIEQVMVPKPVAVSARDTVGKAIAKMSFGGYRRLPIVDDTGRPVGLLKVSSILRYLVEHFPNVVYTLPPAPHHATQQREGA